MVEVDAKLATTAFPTWDLIALSHVVEKYGVTGCTEALFSLSPNDWLKLMPSWPQLRSHHETLIALLHVVEKYGEAGCTEALFFFSPNDWLKLMPNWLQLRSQHGT